jgi:N-acetylmuramoyl-L-alanine amidase
MRWISGSKESNHQGHGGTKRIRSRSKSFSFVRLRPLGGYFLLLALALIVTRALPRLFSSPTGEKRLSIYSNVANYSLPVVERAGRDYVDLLKVLEPLGSVHAKTAGQRWKLRYNNVEGDFTAGRNHCRIGGKDTYFSANFILESGRGLIPLAAMSTLLPRFLGGSLTFHESARRLFIGSVATQFTATISKTIPPRLVLNFSSPVNPTISTEPGRLHMEFSREPLATVGSQTFTFGDKTIPSATYQESNGGAEIAVTGTQPLMASFSNDGRTITIAPAPQGLASSEGLPAISKPVQTLPPSTLPPVPSPPAPAATMPPVSTPTLAVVPHFLVAVDAGHGGDERGATLTSDLPEKDVTLAIARQVRQELQVRGIPVLMVRDSDADLPTDQRATLVNVATASAYICIHASTQGTGVRLYTSVPSVMEENRGPFVPWDGAQTAFVALSQAVVTAVAGELQKKTAVRTLSASVRPMNSVAAPGFLVEVAPPGGDPLQVTSPQYQQLVAAAIATGIATFRDRSGGHP